MSTVVLNDSGQMNPLDWCIVGRAAFTATLKRDVYSTVNKVGWGALAMSGAALVAGAASPWLWPVAALGVYGASRENTNPWEPAFTSLTRGEYEDAEAYLLKHVLLNEKLIYVSDKNGISSPPVFREVSGKGFLMLDPEHPDIIEQNDSHLYESFAKALLLCKWSKFFRGREDTPYTEEDRTHLQFIEKCFDEVNKEGFKEERKLLTQLKELRKGEVPGILPERIRPAYCVVIDIFKRVHDLGPKAHESKEWPSGWQATLLHVAYSLTEDTESEKWLKGLITPFQKVKTVGELAIAVHEVSEEAKMHLLRRSVNTGYEDSEARNLFLRTHALPQII